jgi:hypothetical protein
MSQEFDVDAAFAKLMDEYNEQSDASYASYPMTQEDLAAESERLKTQLRKDNEALVNLNNQKPGTATKATTAMTDAELYDMLAEYEGGRKTRHKRSGHKRSGHKRSGHKRSNHKRSNHKKRTYRKKKSVNKKKRATRRRKH